MIRLLFFCTLLLSTAASASTYYISGTGNDTTGDGSVGTPWLTFAKAFTVMSGGDTLKVENGTYSEKVVVPQSLSGSVGSVTTIEASVGASPVISYDTDVSQAVVIYASYLDFSGIEIDGLNGTTGSYQCLLLTPDTQNITNINLDDLTVHGCSSHGVQMGGTYSDPDTFYAQYITLTNSTIYESNYNNSDMTGSGGWGSGAKVYKYGQDITISGNTIYDNYGEGIGVTRGTDVDVYDNVVYNSFSVNIYIDNAVRVNAYRNFSYCYDADNPNVILRSGAKASGIQVGEEYYGDAPLWGNQLTDLYIYNNVVYNCGRGFGFMGTDTGTGGMRNSVVANNTFYMTEDTPSMVYIIDESESDITFYNNIFKANTATNKFVYFDADVVGTHTWKNNYWVYESTPTTGIETGTGDVTGNLASVDFAGAASTTVSVFDIGASSLGIDGGAITPFNVTSDYAEVSRYNAPDLGAYEYGTGEPPTPDPSQTLQGIMGSGFSIQ